MNQCIRCGHALESQEGVYEYKALPGVMLDGVTMHRCPHCETSYVDIPAIDDLEETIVHFLVTSPGAISGPEFRFLRKFMGVSRDDFGVAADIVRALEASDQTVPEELDELIRKMVRRIHVDDYEAFDAAQAELRATTKRPSKAIRNDDGWRLVAA